MNILGDFITRVNDRYPLDIDNEELNSLLTTIKNQGEELEVKDKEISKLQNMLARFEKNNGEDDKNAPKAKSTKKASTKTTAKTSAKKTTATRRTVAEKKEAEATPAKSETTASK